MELEKDNWDIIIRPRNRRFTLNLKEVWQYRDLLMMYIKRDIVTMYKQTVLGPLWFVIQPLFTVFTYFFIFGKIAQISTDSLPPILFYLSGNMAWAYFSECLGRTSGTFLGNAGVFSKVYFPRLVVPIAASISTLVKFGIQLALFIIIYTYYDITGANIYPTIYLLLFPVLVIMLAFMGIGFGLVISSITTKYRDLALFFGFITQLWMYATPIIYPLSTIPEKYRWIVELNPLTSIIESMKYGLMGEGTFSWISLGYSFCFMAIILLIGIFMFNKAERNFIDVI